MSRSNLAVLTKSHNIIASKKRARKDQLKEVVFDEGARRCLFPLKLLVSCPKTHISCREYLTGFHKRNVEKREAKKQKAIERDKQERLESRREVHLLL